MSSVTGRKKGNLRDKIVLMILFAVVAAVIVGQIYATRAEALASANELQTQIDEYTKQIEELQAKIEVEREATEQISADYDKALLELREFDKDFYSLYSMYTENLASLRLSAGLTTVTGSGIVVRIDDSGLVQGSIVHDSYLVETVNVLKAAGAQAVSVNGQRVLGTTEMLCLGPSIRINDTRQFSPYYIYAIGDADALIKAYRESEIFIRIVRNNLIYDIQRNDSITISGYGGNYKALVTKLF